MTIPNTDVAGDVSDMDRAILSDFLALTTASELVQKYTPKLSPEQTNLLYSEAFGHLQAGNFEPAASILDWLSLTGNRTAAIDEARGYLAFVTGQYDIAHHIYKDLRQRFPENQLFLIETLRSHYCFCSSQGLDLHDLKEQMLAEEPNVTETIRSRFDELKSSVFPNGADT